MQLKKLVAAGAISALMAGSSLGFAAGLADYPQPFVSAQGTADFLIVVGSQGTDAAGLASDVAGAVDIAASLGSRASKPTTVGGSTGGVSVNGEGRDISTANTKLYLYDTLGKSGVRNTLTKDDMPELLKDGQFADSDASTTSNYQQFLYLTPGSTQDSGYQVRYNKPGGSGSEDPTYKIGEITTSPGNTTGSPAYLYKMAVTFDTGINGSTAVGESLTLFGKTYTVHSDTSGTFSGATTDKLVLSGGAEVVDMKGSEKKEVTVGGKTYEVELIGVSSTPAVSVRVTDKATGTTESKLGIAVGSSAKIAGLDVYIDSAQQLSSTVQTDNLAKIQLGSQKITLQQATSVKEGDDNTVVKGTYVRFTTSNSKLDAIDIYAGASDTKQDFLKIGGELTDPLFKTFKLSFPSISTELTDEANRDKISVQNSGNDLVTITLTDWRGKSNTVNFGYMASGGTTQSLADADGSTVWVQENATVAENDYIVLDAGDFGRIFEVTSISLTSDASSAVTLSDVISGDTITATLGADNQGTKVIDGQTYYFMNRSSASGSPNNRISVTWGAGATAGSLGTFTTVYPSIKTKKSAHIAFMDEGGINVTNNTKLQLPTGAVTVSYTGPVTGDEDPANWTLTAANNEDGTSSVVTRIGGSSIVGSEANSVIFEVGLTAAAGAKFNVTKMGGANGTAFLIRPVGENNATITHASLLLAEEKDDSANEHVIYIPTNVDTSGSTNKAEVGTIRSSDDNSTMNANMVTLSATDTNKKAGVDLYGTYALQNTDGQDTVTIYYPDDQVSANIFVLAQGATTSTTGATSGTTVQESVPITTAVARLDSEVQADQAAKTTKSLILVGGPVVNSLVAELASAAKTWDAQKYRDNGEGTYVLDYVDNAFGGGKAALVVAGHSAADTRASSKMLVNPTGLTGMRMAWKNGVVLADAV